MGGRSVGEENREVNCCVFVGIPCIRYIFMISSLPQVYFLRLLMCSYSGSFLFYVGTKYERNFLVHI